jgi:hypothetical protein
MHRAISPFEFEEFEFEYRAMCQGFTYIKCQNLTRILAHSLSVFVKFRRMRKIQLQKQRKGCCWTIYRPLTTIMVSGDIDTHSYVLYPSEFNAPICRTCQHGLTREGVACHFQRHHKSIPYSVTKPIVSFASGLIYFLNIGLFYVNFLCVAAAYPLCRPPRQCLL